MKYDFDTIITNIDGTSIVLSQGKYLDLKSVCISALTEFLPGDESTTGEEKFLRYKIALKISNGGVVDISPEDVILIKNAVGQIYNPVVVGRTYELMNG